jgi:hypothetical protein
MTKDTLKKLVIEEAKNLKKFATNKELGELFISALNPLRDESCVYGLMTGDCTSKRANELITKCCSAVVLKTVSRVISDVSLVNIPMSNHFAHLPRLTYWSPIEVFVARPQNKINGNNQTLIKFLKGEIKTLKFKEPMPLIDNTILIHFRTDLVISDGLFNLCGILVVVAQEQVIKWVNWN